MVEGTIDFWFTMGSTYSYLSVQRLNDVERASGVSFRWRPFHLLLILQEMKHVPFADKPAKARYMWRDIERRAAMYGLPARLPAPYPAKQSVTANLVAIVGMREGWGADFVRAAYRRWFVQGERPAASLICWQACAISGRIRAGCWRWRTLPKPTTICWPRPTPPESWEFSVRRPLPSGVKSSGATIASTTRSAGLGAATPEEGNRAPIAQWHSGLWWVRSARAQRSAGHTADCRAHRHSRARPPTPPQRRARAGSLPARAPAWAGSAG